MYLMTDVYDLPAYTGNKLEQTVTKDLRVPPRVIIPPYSSSTYFKHRNICLEQFISLSGERSNAIS